MIKFSSYLAGAMAMVSLTFGAVPASAHGGVTTRSLVLQVDDHGVAGMWDVTESGKRASLQVTILDLDRDGRLSNKEKAAVAAVIVQRIDRLRLAACSYLQGGARVEVKMSAVDVTS